MSSTTASLRPYGTPLLPYGISTEFNKIRRRHLIAVGGGSGAPSPSTLDAWYLDPAAGTPQVRNHSGKVWAKDHSRTGSVREMQSFRSYYLNGTDGILKRSEAFFSDVDFSVFCKVRLESTLDAGSYIYGFASGSDRVSLLLKRPGSGLDHAQLYIATTGGGYIADSGVILSTGVDYDILVTHAKTIKTVGISINGSAFATVVYTGTLNLIDPWFRIGGVAHTSTTKTALMQGWLFNFQAWNDVLATVDDLDAINAHTWETGSRICNLECDEASGSTGIDSSSAGNNFVLEAASIANFHDEPTTAPAGYRSPQNEIGYTEGTGSNGAAVGVFIPLVSPTLDALGNAAQYSGPCPHDGRLLGPCATLNGVGDVCVAQNSTNVISSNMSFGGWFELFETDSAGFVSKGVNTQWGLFHEGAFIKLRLLAGSDVSVTHAGVSGLHHVFATLNGTTGKIYIDGAEVASGPTGLLPATNNEPIQVGKFGTVYAFGGKACGVHVYGTRTLTADEVLYLASNGVSGTDPGDTGLFDFWHMQEPTGIVHAGQNGNDLDVTTASQANYHANQQDVFDYLSTQNGKRNPGQTIDIFGGEPNSPYALELAGLGATRLQDFGDDDEADVVFARVDVAGDDRIIVDLTKDQIAALQGYT